MPGVINMCYSHTLYSFILCICSKRCFNIAFHRLITFLVRQWEWLNSTDCYQCLTAWGAPSPRPRTAARTASTPLAARRGCRGATTPAPCFPSPRGTSTTRHPRLSSSLAPTSSFWSRRSRVWSTQCWSSGAWWTVRFRNCGWRVRHWSSRSRGRSVCARSTAVEVKRRVGRRKSGQWQQS